MNKKDRWKQVDRELKREREIYIERGPYQVQPLPDRLDLGAMARKEYFAFAKVSALLEPQIRLLIVISRTLGGVFYHSAELESVYSTAPIVKKVLDPANSQTTGIKSQVNKDYVIQFGFKARKGKVPKTQIQKVNPVLAKCPFPCKRFLIKRPTWSSLWLTLRRLSNSL